MSKEYVPYETLARAEAQDVLQHEAWLDTLGISEQNRWKLLELMAGMHAQGLEQGFAISDFSGDDPAKAMDIFNAGYALALEDIRKLGE
jgi:hypothetical protein